MIIKKQLETLRQQQMLKAKWYNRYLLLRYSLAIFFFANVNWALINIVSESWASILPIILVLLAIPAVYEQMKLYGMNSHQLIFTKHYLKLQMLVQILLCFVCLSPLFKVLFPIFTSHWQTRLMLGLVFILGIGLALLNLRRIVEIEHNVDKFYVQFQQVYSIK